MKLCSILCISTLAAFLCAGCAKEEPAARTSNAVVDVVTQRNAVEAGQRAKATLNKVQSQREQDFEEALGDGK